jgi:hypothetical protein
MEAGNTTGIYRTFCRTEGQNKCRECRPRGTQDGNECCERRPRETQDGNKCRKE